MTDKCCSMNKQEGEDVVGYEESKLNAPLRGRTFSGCWACRLHKRRCDDKKPHCTFCLENNIKCCYDVRLIWLDENSYRILSGDSAQLVRLSHLKRKKNCNRFKLKRRRVSRDRFAKMGLSPPSSDSEVEAEDGFGAEEKENDAKHTSLNIRRLQIYDNHVKSVYGNDTGRNYDQKHVNSILNGFLKKLDLHTKRVDRCLDLKQGPYSMFSVISIKKDANLKADCDTKYKGNDDTSKNNNKNNNIPSPNNQDQIRKTEMAQLNDKKLFITDLVENKIYTILWLNTNDNMILSRQEYCTWFLEYMKSILPFEFCKILEKIINDTQSTNISRWLSIIKNDWFNNPDWQTISFTLLTVIHGYTCPALCNELESWFLTKSILQYSMYPLINFIVRNSTNLKVLYHCNELLNNNNECSQNSYQDELMYELNVLVTKKVVNIWRDKILQQLCSCEDTTKSCSQLRYWEVQLEYNENFYSDVYSS